MGNRPQLPGIISVSQKIKHMIRVDASEERNAQQVLPFFLLSEAVTQHEFSFTHSVEGAGKRAAYKPACSGYQNHSIGFPSGNFSKGRNGSSSVYCAVRIFRNYSNIYPGKQPVI
jgi:hypothetical protein